MAGLSIRGYARHRKVSHTAVRKALAAGRITSGPDGTIDPAVADEQWANATDLAKPRNSVTGMARKRRAPGAHRRSWRRVRLFVQGEGLPTPSRLDSRLQLRYNSSPRNFFEAA